MPTRVKILIVLMLASAAWSVKWAASGPHGHDWVRFGVYLAAVLLSSGLKVAMPKGDGTMSVNFPFILLGILELAPEQAVALAAISVFAQCRVQVLKPFTVVQIAFNVGNVVAATAVACYVYTWSLHYRHEMAPALALAATAYFFANTVPVALVIAWSKGEKPFSFWRRQFPWYLPFYLVGAFLAVIIHLTTVDFGWLTSLLIFPIVYTIYRAYRAQSLSIQERQRHLEETEALHLRAIEGLAMAIEAKDQNTHDHLLRVRVYGSEIGKLMGMDELGMRALLTASFLHDIGKLAVPEHIINKPGKLTPEEFDKMKIHPVVGADILERVRFPYPVVPIVRSHHEAWDGSGYPDGLKGEEIPLGARILSVVDCFDALASDRPYRRAVQVPEALEHIRSKSGTQFDPAVVRILEEHYLELEELARKESQTLAPLMTNLRIARGAAPGAGFEEQNYEAPPEILEGDARGPLSMHQGALDLIAAASQEAQAIFEMSRTLGNSLNSNETASMMSSRLRQWIAFDCFAIYVNNGNLLMPHYMDGDYAESLSMEPVALGEGISGWVAATGKTIINGNPEVEPNHVMNADSSRILRSALALPLYGPNGGVFGVLTLYSAAENAFSKDHLRILLAVESKFSLSLQNAFAFRDVNTHAQVDFITQLPNVRQFFIEMERKLDMARNLTEPLGIVVCDLNSFKAVNDKYGHVMGNKLLRVIADALRKSCRKEDVVARMGGDEFVMLLPGVNSSAWAPRLKRLEASVREASKTLGIEVTTSIGAAFYPDDCSSAEALLGLADRRMYAHKQQLGLAGHDTIPPTTASKLAGAL
ncbi:MAG: diguanylate cyclase [Acidobacteriaceae bacterium]|nr:diguanylate cyclase [Acidobacteriaceae bacterium]